MYMYIYIHPISSPIRHTCIVKISIQTYFNDTYFCFNLKLIIFKGIYFDIEFWVNS